MQVLRDSPCKSSSGRLPERSTKKEHKWQKEANSVALPVKAQTQRTIAQPEPDGSSFREQLGITRSLLVLQQATAGQEQERSTRCQNSVDDLQQQLQPLANTPEAIRQELGPSMATDLDDLDFSSYLVDDVDAGAPSQQLQGVFAPVLQMKQPRAWSAALTANAPLTSVSPSPPETSNSEASFKAVSAPSTAPSSVFSTSYPLPSTSWSTVVSPVASAAGEFRVSLPSGSKAASPSRRHDASTTLASASGAGAALASDAAFNYDFAHDPSAGADLSGSLSAGPSSTSLSSIKRSSRTSSFDRKAAEGPSSYPAPQSFTSALDTSSGKAHRSKPSASLPHASTFGQQTWTPLTQGASHMISSAHQTKPYARPAELAPVATSSAAGSSSLGAKRSVKRKTMSIASSTALQSSARKDAQLSLQSTVPNNLFPGFSVGPDYRDPPALLSPASPSHESIAAFSAQFLANQSADVGAASPGRQFSNPSSASTPSEGMLPGYNIGFSPRNFADLSVASGNTGHPLGQAYQIPQPLHAVPGIVRNTGSLHERRPNSYQTEQATDADPAALAATALLGDPIIPPAVAKAARRGREASLAPDGVVDLDGDSPEAMAARDPLATHLWRVYAKAKSGLPNGARMENLTWRMMSLKLNKQKAAEAAQAAADAKARAQAESATKAKEAEIAAAEEERGRRGRSVGNSASPQDDFADMDWRQQSRSRSRAPAPFTGMDWRAQSRSRSRAPNARISMPRGGSGFQLPQYIEASESRASASRTDVYSHQPKSSTSGSFPTMFASPEPVSASADLEGYGSIEATLKQLIASTESTAQRTKSKTPSSTSGQTPPAQAFAQPATAVSGFTYVSPAPLPTSPVAASWAQPSTASSFLPASSLSQSFQSSLTPAQTITTDSSSSRSQDSISRSIEAYLASLNYPSAHLDMHTGKHVGSVPGLFDEQSLKHNQHAEYGFLPKLVRKTSFDASYPAQLAQMQQKQKKPKSSLAHVSWI